MVVGIRHTGPSVYGAYCPVDVNDQARAIRFFEDHSDEFLAAISECECLPIGSNPNTYELFEEVVARQNSFSSQVYKHFKIMVGDNQVIIADKDNDGLLDHFSVNEFYSGAVLPIILDGNNYDPLISTILESNREPSYCDDERFWRQIVVAGLSVFAVIETISLFLL